MGHGMASIMETIFDLAYLATVWVLVALMARGKSRTRPEEAGMSFRFLLAFLLLALGDSFHVGFRVVAEFLGEGAAFTTVGGVRSSLLGLGGLATAYTMTGFYMVLADARRLRSGGVPDAATWLMQSLFALRLVLMALPGNAWEAAVPPAAMGILRNVPLSIAGFLMAALFVAEGRRSGDRAWAGIGWAMLASYLFYAPVILFVRELPLLGLLMIPKTLAYLVMGIVAYRRYWPARG